MNKKSKIKTTLDSLFTGGGIKPKEDKADVENKFTTAKPASIAKGKESVQSVKKTSSLKPEKKQEEAKPVTARITEVSKTEQFLPVETTKPVVSELLSQIPPLVSAADTSPVPLPKPTEPQPPVVPAGKVNLEAEQVPTIESEINRSKEAEMDEEEHLVIFTLGKELYGVTIHSVESIIKIQAITEVPRTASFVLGVTNLRGTVVPVLDLRKRFNLQFTETTPNTRIIIVNAEGSKVGIVVDEVTEVLKVARHSIQPPPPLATTIESTFISGVARINDRLVILLDLEKVLSSSSKQYIR